MMPSHNRNTVPTTSKLNAACHDIQMSFCSRYASVAMLGPLNGMPITYRLQFVFTDPAGPKSWMLVSTSPVSQRTKRMNVPRMTMPGRSWRWEMRPMRRPRKRRPREDTVI